MCGRDNQNCPQNVVSIGTDATCMPPKKPRAGFEHTFVLRVAGGEKHVFAAEDHLSMQDWVQVGPAHCKKWHIVAAKASGSQYRLKLTPMCCDGLQALRGGELNIEGISSLADSLTSVLGHESHERERVEKRIEALERKMDRGFQAILEKLERLEK